jgi:hypothetical protein
MRVHCRRLAWVHAATQLYTSYRQTSMHERAICMHSSGTDGVLVAQRRAPSLPQLITTQPNTLPLPLLHQDVRVCSRLSASQSATSSAEESVTRRSQGRVAVQCTLQSLAEEVAITCAPGARPPPPPPPLPPHTHLLLSFLIIMRHT